MYVFVSVSWLRPCVRIRQSFDRERLVLVRILLLSGSGVFVALCYSVVPVIASFFVFSCPLRLRISGC